LRDYNFGLNISHDLTNYLNCRTHVDYESKTTFVMETHFINNLERIIGEEVNNLSGYGNPGTTRFKIVRPGDNIERIDSNLPCVGMLLFLIKHSRPDFANVVCELSKFMDGSSTAAYKEMQIVVKFVLDTKLYCLKMQPKDDSKEWDLVSC
jgi:hypothetical protein